ncbi:hypothetical protein [Roseomonas xinghualingensis]|uniref:hypothetical protein n=1 Tax=Roseomonas xinghualingensis TaxID=2986475 RepID=UPI0021F22DFF|nr:hypothetical protein [Roseomonas sp. SXEYE001]MCV4206903.1 hypothetical protein [Roseomonas sp. SXEYE001]
MAARPKTTAAQKAPPMTRPVVKEKAFIAKVAEYALAKADADACEARLKKLKPEILAGMGEHRSVIAGNHVVSRGEVPDVPPTDNVTITREMVGQVIPGRKGRAGYNTLTVQ